MVGPARPNIAFAKTTRPTIGSAVEREALFTRLDTPSGRTVVWISGAPGSGKTTLAASYVQARGTRSVWYQVDADDADPASFFYYLAHAVRKLGPARPRDLPAFTAQHADDVASFSRKFFRQLFVNATAPFAIVFDNLHLVEPDAALYPVFEAGFSQVPKGCCVIVTTRGAPLASLARLQAEGQMCCFTGNDLRFGPDEIVAIAALRGQAISPEAAAKLYERTHGWAAGLVLMLEHSKFSGQIVDVPGDATPQVIFDFLAGEIFDRFEPQTREFLLRVACLPRMTATVAAMLAAEPKAERLLINLARNDYFVRDVASEAGRVYQIHPLLREFLKSRARQSMPEVVSAAWLRRAALLAQDAGQTEDAVALLIDAGDWDEVARIALETGDGFLAQGRSETLGRWLELLPPKQVETDPRLLRMWGASRAHASPRTARQLFERAFEGFRAGGDVAGMMRCCCGVIDAIVLEFDDVTPLDRWLETLDGLLAQGGDTSFDQIDAVATTTLIRATLLRDAGNPRLAGWLDRAQRGLQAGAVAQLPEAVREELAVARGMAALARGDVAAADVIVGSLRGERSGSPSSVHLAQAMAAGLNHLVRGSYDDARRVVCDALAAADAEGIRAYDEWLYVVAAAASMCAGDRVGVRNGLEKLEAASARLRRGDRACVHFLRAWLAALAGDAIAAQRDAKLALAISIETGIPWFEALARLALVQLQDNAADRRGVEAQLRSAEALADRLASPWLRVGVDLAASAVLREQGDTESALEKLRAALRLGREHGIRPPPGWRPQPLAELGSLALETQIEPEFARTLVREGRLTPRAPPLLVREWPWRFRIAALGEFQCFRGEAPIELSVKGPGRPKELLKVLVAFGRHNVRTDQLADALWPHMEADYGYKSFTATLHRLRRALEDEDALVLRDGRLSLNKSMVWVDTWALEQLLDNFEALVRRPDAEAAMHRKFVDEALTIYRGPFLPDESDQPCYIACREQLRARMLRSLGHVARRCEAAGAPEAAADVYLRFIEVDELCEPPYRQLMMCYQRSESTMDALATYERLRTILAARLKVMPSPETQQLYLRIKSGGAEATAP